MDRQLPRTYSAQRALNDRRNAVTNPEQRIWQTHAIEQRYENAWITLTHRSVTAPTGNPGIYGLVHYKNTAIGVIPIDAQGFTWLVGQHRYPHNQYGWEIPEGGAPLGESALAAAQRELREETGITARRWTSLLKMHPSNSVSDEVAYAFVAQDLSYGESAPDDTELLRVERLPLTEAIAMALDGRIVDGFAMAALLKVGLLLDRGLLTV